MLIPFFKIHNDSYETNVFKLDSMELPGKSVSACNDVFGVSPESTDRLK